MRLPGPVRAAVGLVATAADEARRIPDRALELPMLAVSTALQASVRAQQRYARLTARGDQLLSRQAPTDDPPSWATFDDTPPEPPPVRGRSAFDRAAETLDATDAPNPADTATAAAQLIGDLVGSNNGVARTKPRTEPRTPPARKTTATETTAAAETTTAAAAKTPAKKTAAKKTPAAKSPAAKSPATKTAAKKTPAKTTAAKKTPAKDTPADASPETTTAPAADSGD